MVSSEAVPCSSLSAGIGVGVLLEVALGPTARPPPAKSTQHKIRVGGKRKLATTR